MSIINLKPITMKKQFNLQRNIGKTKYVLNIYDGVSTHNDGSPFWGIACFKSIKKLNECRKSLIQQGYIDMDTTPVIFRKMEDQVVAFFPTIENGMYIMSYMHVGQHSDADPTLIDELKPATKKEYQELYDELVQIGYTDMKVYKTNIFN